MRAANPSPGELYLFFPDESHTKMPKLTPARGENFGNIKIMELYGSGFHCSRSNW